MKPQLIQTPWSNAELIPKIIITNGVEPLVMLPVLQIVIPKVRRGDILHVTGYCQVSNNTHLYGEPGYNLMVASYLCLQLPDVKNGVPTLFELELSEKNSRNVNTQRHHEPIHCFTDYESRYDLDNAILQMKIYSASTAARPNQYLTVDQDYGRLSCLLWSDAQ